MRSVWNPQERLEIRRSDWSAMLTELAKRGCGVRESGAFVLSPLDRRVATEIVYFDDLDPHCLVGNIQLSGDAFSTLWDHCRVTTQRVIADVHTHPSTSVAFSSIDRANPMVAQSGHVAIVVPRFAQHKLTRRQIGVHRYDGDAGWTSFFDRAAVRRIGLARG